MENFVNAARCAVHAGNWYAALAMALTLPDMAGKAEWPSKNRGRESFVRWFELWLQPTYSVDATRFRPAGFQLTGSDCYALRCAYLHQGSLDLEGPGANAIEAFRFIPPPADGHVYHRNMFENTMQLQVDLFTWEVCEAVERWLVDARTRPEVAARIDSLARINPLW